MPNDNTVSVPLPVGMTADQFQKSMQSFFKMQNYTKLHDKAVRKAQKKLSEKYPADYKTFLAAELKAVGLKQPAAK